MVKSIFTNLKGGAVAVLLLCFPVFIQAQTMDADSLFLRLNNNRVSLSGTVAVYNNLKFKHYGAKYLKSYPIPSLFVNAQYHQKISDTYGINTGFGATVLTLNATYNFNHTFTEPYEFIEEFNLFHMDYFLILGEVPLSVQKTFPIRSKSNSPLALAVEAGVKCNFLLDDPAYFTGTIDSIGDEAYFIMLMELYSYRPALESYFLKVGIHKFNKWKDILQFNLVIGYSPKKLVKGEYAFLNPPFESSGTVTQGINYIGFEYSHGLSW